MKKYLITILIPIILSGCSGNEPRTSQAPDGKNRVSVNRDHPVEIHKEVAKEKSIQHGQ